MALATDIAELEQIIINSLTDELEQQGHKLTGKLMKSIQINTKLFLNGFEMEGSFFNYGGILDRGTKASRIPFGGSKTGKKTSKYIQGLKDFALKRKMTTDPKEALGIAFAIAKTQKRDGMPTKASFVYSKNGRRKNWIDFGLEQATPKIFAKISEIVVGQFNVSIDNIIRQQNKQN
jgi:hypothetical protein